MSKGIELAKAYVQVVPSAEGIQGSLQDVFNKEGGDAGKTFGTSFGSVMKVVGAAAAGVGAGAIAAKVKQIVNESVEAYGDYEQLTGGVEKLFGTSADTVLKYAQDAYKAAGMSANEYMETITGFSASLISSLNGDTKAAAEIGDMAVKDMSDNANTFGTDLASIQNAYQGFAKQNYTMLDNLKLGYGGTKTEMQRLVADAEKLDSTFIATRDDTGELTLAFADIAKAINIVQTDMKITGTTAREAGDTIQGSAAATKAAWENLQTTMADGNGDTKTAVNAWLDSLETSVEKKTEAIGNFFKNLPEAIGSVVEAVGNKVRELYIDAVMDDDVEARLDSIGQIMGEHAERIKNINGNLKEGLIPLDDAKAYWSAFKDLIEEDGNIASDKMGEAQILVDGINERLGTQYSTQDLINGLLNGESESLDVVLEKKQAEVLLEQSRQLMNDTEAELAALNAEKEANDALIATYQAELAQMDMNSAAYWKKRTELEGLQIAQDQTTQTIAADMEILGQCYENETAAAQGNYDQIVVLNADKIKSAGTVTQGMIDEYDAQIKAHETTIAQMKEIQAKGDSDSVRARIAAAEAELAAVREKKSALLAVQSEEKAGLQRTQQQMYSDVLTSYSKMKDAAVQKINEQKSAVGTATSEMRAVSGRNMDALKSDAESKFGSINFSNNQPHIPTPAWSLSGIFDLQSGSVPTVSSWWHASAMDEAEILNKPTIFGLTGTTLHGAGEAGPEVISGEEHLIGLINGSVAEALGEVLTPLLSQIAGMLRTYLPKAAEDRPIVLDDGTLVGKLTPGINKQLEVLNRQKERGM